MKYLVVLISACLLAIACGDSNRKVKATPTGRGGPNPNLNMNLNKNGNGNLNANLSTKEKSETEKLSYSYNVNGCKTDKQQFTSTDELCKGLQNKTLNKGCALELRKIKFQAECRNQEFQETEE